MLKKLLLAAFAAGLLSGAAVTTLHAVATTPLILHAEEYEHAAPAAHHHDTAAPPHEHAATAPAEAEMSLPVRAAFTAMADMVTGSGYALLLVAAFLLSGRRVDAREGVLWGLAGYAAFNLAPAVGLPPELPGMQAADLAMRQGWWLLTAAATAAGLWALTLGDDWTRRAGGIALLLLPHAVGAPAPDAIGGAVPPELAAEFTARTLAVNAVFWAVLGLLSGYFCQRFGVVSDRQGSREETVPLATPLR